MDEEGELHQYVIYEQEKPKGPKVIKLDDPKGKNAEMENYTPPTSLTVHLSKIDMPELKPRATGNVPPDKNTNKKGKGKEKEKEKPGKKDDKKSKRSPSPRSSSKPPSPGLTNPPPIPLHSRPQQQSGALNSVTPPPQLGSVVSNLMGRLDRFTKR